MPHPRKLSAKEARDAEILADAERLYQQRKVARTRSQVA